MKPIHIKLLKAECLKFQVNRGLRIIEINDKTFIASDEDSIIHVEIEHLYNQLQQGHSVHDTLENEMGHIERGTR